MCAQLLSVNDLQCEKSISASFALISASNSCAHNCSGTAQTNRTWATTIIPASAEKWTVRDCPTYLKILQTHRFPKNHTKTRCPTYICRTKSRRNVELHITEEFVVCDGLYPRHRKWQPHRRVLQTQRKSAWNGLPRKRRRLPSVHFGKKHGMK